MDKTADLPLALLDLASVRGHRTDVIDGNMGTNTPLLPGPRSPRLERYPVTSRMQARASWPRCLTGEKWVPRGLFSATCSVLVRFVSRFLQAHTASTLARHKLYAGFAQWGFLLRVPLAWKEMTELPW